MVPFEDIYAKILDRMDERWSYVNEGDDRTFSNQITDHGFWVDGWNTCFKEFLSIAEEEIKKGMEEEV